MIFNFLRRAPRLLGPVARMYGRRLDQCGTTAQGVFWRGEEWQIRRFARMAEAFSAEDQESGQVVINDLGCGYGAFFDYLAMKPIMRDSTYHGYDITQEMIAACRDRISDPRAHFHRNMVATKRADYSFACGTYNLNGNADDRAWNDYVEESLTQLWEKTEKVLAFNMLRRDADDKYQGLYYIDPEEMLRFCRRTLSGNSIMIDETPLPDVTFFVRK